MLPTRSALRRMLLLLVIGHLAILGIINRAPIVAAHDSAALVDSTQFVTLSQPALNHLQTTQTITGTWNSRLANNLNIPGTITNLVFADDGRLTVLGDFNYLNGQLVNGLATMSQQGTWQGYGLHADDSGTLATAAYYHDQLYLGGRFKRLAGTPLNGIALWNGTNFAAVGSGVSRSDATTARVGQLGVMSDTLYLAGNFNRFNGQPTSGIIGWRNQQLVSIPSYPIDEVHGMKIVDDRMMITHTHPGEEPYVVSYALWQNDEWIEMPWPDFSQRYNFQWLFAGNDGFYRPIYSDSNRTHTQVQVWQTDQWTNSISTSLKFTYMSFTQLANQQIYVSDSKQLYQLTPAAWQLVNLPMQIRRIDTLANRNNLLYLAGDFTLNGQPSSLVRWDGTQLESLATTMRYANVASLGGQQGRPIAHTKDFNPFASYDQKLFTWNTISWQPLVHKITSQPFQVLSVDDQTSYFGSEHAITTTNNIARNLWQIQSNGTLSDVFGASTAISTWTISGSQLLGNLYGDFLKGVVLINQGQISNLAPYTYPLAIRDQVLMTGDQLYAVEPSGERGYWHTHFKQWDGTSWQEIAILGITDSQSRLQIVGWRGSLYFLEHNQLRRFNRTSSDLVATFDQVPNVLVADDDDFLYVGGPFASVDTVATGTLARWDGTSWQGLAQPANGEVTQISVNDRHLYLAGKFTHVGETPSLGVAALSFGPPENTTYLCYLPQIVR
ncbi:MAG TPA: hypothetical protein DEF47_09665 [Herpetosiphon sp.]|uniref:Uncharacterized protein n=1 Tax=Herpetosiphon aurantiacus (strain ATCC 23779 / DSM 785 / 114-95) TaxID=316274 RepID=A9B8D7_HERA2|nr:hypothetical protein [Herpetosiphon sp.]ABX06490.1 hypothetical protein Haur_3856 [Herpetosiphon aurantiacus DSM 785]HBW50160.1 hypothetical protein [Herpetosiphon sp.]